MKSIMSKENVLIKFSEITQEGKQVHFGTLYIF